MALDEMFGQFMHSYPVKHQENNDSSQTNSRKCVLANPDPGMRASTAENEGREDKDLEEDANIITIKPLALQMALNFIRYEIKSADIMLRSKPRAPILQGECKDCTRVVDSMPQFPMNNLYRRYCYVQWTINGPEWIRFEHTNVQKCIKYGKSAVCWEQHCDKQVIHSYASAILKGFSHSQPYYYR